MDSIFPFLNDGIMFPSFPLPVSLLPSIIRRGIIGKLSRPTTTKSFHSDDQGSEKLWQDALPLTNSDQDPMLWVSETLEQKLTLTNFLF